MGSGLAAPFYITLARSDLGQSAALLGIFIAVEGPRWAHQRNLSGGRWADRSSRLVFAAACTLSAVGSIAVGSLGVGGFVYRSPGGGLFLSRRLLFSWGLSHAGVRLGRKTYLVDMADGNQRTDYVAVEQYGHWGRFFWLPVWWRADGNFFPWRQRSSCLPRRGLAGAALSLSWEEVSGSR